MSDRTRKGRWHAVAITGLLSIAGLAGCGDSQVPESVAQAPESSDSAGDDPQWDRQALALSTDDAAYLTQIGLMRGHLWVGHQLYLNDLADLSATHMKHPEAELYSSLVDAFDMRGVEGFADALSALSEGVSGNRSKAEVQQAYDALQQRIAQSESGADTGSARVIGAVVVGLLRTAAQEYAVGVVDGQINNVHEYQDALGFTRIARQWSDSPVFATDEQTRAVAAAMQAILDALFELWPELAPAGSMPFQAAQIAAAADQIERQVLELN